MRKIILNLFKNKKRIYLLVLTLQVLTAFILILLIFKKITPDDSPNSLIGGSASMKDGNFSELGSETVGREWNENNILEMLNQEASEEEKESHYLAASKLAKAVSVVELNNCKATPVVSKAKKGTNLKFKNNDSVDHSLKGFGGNLTYKIPAKSETEILINFGKGLGHFGYFCDNAKTLAGSIFVAD